MTVALRRALHILPAATAVAYLATAAAMGAEITRLLGWDSDVASRLVLAARLRGSGNVYIPHFGAWTSLWFELATRGLPGHSRLWDTAGYVFAVIGAVILGWGTARVAGRWAGVTAFAIAVVVGPLALRSLFTLAYHVTNPFTAIVLGALVVALPHPRAWLLAIPVGILAGVNAASDPLLLAAGVAPFVVAGTVLWRATLRREIAVRVALTIVVTAAAAFGTGELMRSLGYHVTSAGVRLASPHDFPGHVLLLGRMIALAGGANYAIGGGYPREPLRALVALLVLAAALTPTVAAVQAFRRREDAIRRAYACYWAGSTLILGVVFVVTTNAGELGPGSVNYILSVAPAAGVGVALLARRSANARLLAAAAIALVGAVNIAGVVHGRAGTPRGEIGVHEPALVRLLAAKHVTRGYASYWDAANVTWQSGLRVFVAPVGVCSSGAQPLCPFRSSVIDSWYTRRSGPTFLIVDPTTAFVTSPPPFVRKARATYRFGRLTVYVFRGDVARYIDARA